MGRHALDCHPCSDVHHDPSTSSLWKRLHPLLSSFHAEVIFGQAWRTSVSQCSQQDNAVMPDRVVYRTCNAVALDIPGAVVNAVEAMRVYLLAAGLMEAPLDAPVFFYRSRSSSLEISIASLVEGPLAARVSAPTFSQRRVFRTRTGRRTLSEARGPKVAACGVQDFVIRKLGKIFFRSQATGLITTCLTTYLAFSLPCRRITV